MITISGTLTYTTDDAAEYASALANFQAHPNIVNIVQDVPKLTFTMEYLEEG